MGAPAGRSGQFDVTRLRKEAAPFPVGGRSWPNAGDCREYWRSRLNGLENLALPFDRPAGDGESGIAETEQLPLPEVVIAATELLALQEGATPLMVHITTLHILLSRYSGMSNFGIGTPTLSYGRPGYPQSSPALGWVVLRQNTAAGATFRQLLASMRESMTEALMHVDIPFEQLVEDLNPVREGNRNPLFQVSIAECTGTANSDSDDKAHNLDLRMDICDNGETCRVDFRYRSTRFDRSSIAFLARHYLLLLTAAIASPDTAATSLPFLHPAQLRTINDWNSTTVPRLGRQTLTSLVQSQCARTPQAIAISSHGADITYAQLLNRVEQAAAALGNAGMKPGDTIGVQLPRSAESIVLALAIMRIGGVYLPMDPDWPEQRSALVSEISGARLIIRDDLPPAGSSAIPATGADPASVAYILFTSGSTGAPKGVEVEHRSICNHLQWFVEATGLSSADVFLFKTSPTFDASLVEMFAPLVVGAKIVVAGARGDLDPPGLLRSIREHGVTILQSVPSASRALLAVGGIKRCSSLRYLVLGGEALEADLARALKAELPTTRIGNFYGPTEATIDATFHEMENWDSAIVPIGKPIANTRCYVLDDSQRMQPVGVWGELYIAGLGVARGYCGRPDLTAARFHADPFYDCQRMYQTGDRARWRHDGTLEFAGRSDGQVKMRGLRIELGEIESALRLLPGVADAVVVNGNESDPHAPVLTAFVVPRSETSSSTEDIRNGLSKSIPGYMLPNRIVSADSIPMLPSGKTDRAALRRLVSVFADGSLPAMPRTSLERSLLTLWQDSLGTQQLGVDSDFFEHGGHSLLALQVVTKMRTELELACTLEQLFTHSTVRKLAEALVSKSASPHRGVVLSLQPQGSRPPVYCICGIQIYRQLAEHLGPDIPVHGVFLPWEEQILEDSRDYADLTVEEMAQRYLRVIRKHQPSGPFSVLGLSFGGVLALEIARQCADSDDAPPLVAILDMPPVEKRGRFLMNIWLKCKQQSARLLARCWNLARTSQIRDLRLPVEDKRSLLYESAMQSHETRPYAAGRVLVFRATECSWGRIGRDPSLGWHQFIPAAETLDAPGDHLGILLDPGAQHIAEALRLRLP
jgi:amino acid adenylation domain-containing protein